MLPALALLWLFPPQEHCSQASAQLMPAPPARLCLNLTSTVNSTLPPLILHPAPQRTPKSPYLVLHFLPHGIHDLQTHSVFHTFTCYFRLPLLDPKYCQGRGLCSFHSSINPRVGAQWGPVRSRCSRNTELGEENRKLPIPSFPSSSWVGT